MPWRGRQRKRERLQSAHGPRSRRVQAREQHALRREPVEIRREAARVAEAAEILGRQRLDRDQHDVELLLRPGGVDPAFERQRRVVGEVRSPGLEELLAQFLLCPFERDGCVEAVVVDLVGVERVEELPDAVAGELLGLRARAELFPAGRHHHERQHRHQRIGSHPH
jgi:hypothetical protein